MFAPLFILALAILSIIGASSVAILDQERATVNLASAMSAFYATESTIEEGLYDIRQAKEHPDEKNSNTLIRSHAKQKNDLTKKNGTINVDGLSVELVDREFADVPARIGNPIPKSSGEFRFLDVDTQHPIAEIQLHLQDVTHDDAIQGGVLLDVIYFPRVLFAGSADATKIDFGTIANLASKHGDTNRNIHRVMYRTIDSKKSVLDNDPLGVTINEACTLPGYLTCLKVSGLNTNEWNYIVRWQALDQGKVHYAITATYDGDNSALTDVANQLIEVDALTATQNMYQRIKQQEASFAPLQPGLSFALFSDSAITK